MVTVTGQLVAWVLARLLSGVVFTSRAVDQLREIDTSGPVVYVLRSKSLIDYLYFNIAFQRHGIRLVRFANGVNTWSVRPWYSALRTLLRGRRGLPNDEACFRSAVRSGEPTLLFLDTAANSHGGRGTLARRFLQQLLELERDAPTGATLVPLLLVWDKNPDRDQPTLLDEVFGTRQNPGFFRKLLLVAKQTWESFLHLGAPQVQVGTPVSAAMVRDEVPDALARRMREAVDLERRLIVGPEVKSARRIREEVLSDPRTVGAIQEIALSTGEDFGALQVRAASSLQSIAADFSMLMIKVLSSLLTAIFNQIYDGLDIDVDGLESVRDLGRRKRVVLVPSHKSHIDYLVLSYVFYNHSLIPPHIAAGDNLSFWPIGPVFRRAGAFFLRRSFAGDPLYTRIFNAYLVKLLEEGFFIEFFIEGTRSRTGKLNPPKYGMLNMLVDAYAGGGVGDLAFVPVSVGYENVIEGSSYQAELEGGEKKTESLGGLLRTSRVLQSKYGRVYVEFGDAIDAGEFLSTHHPAGLADAPRDDVERTVRRLAYGIIHGINAVTTVTPSALAALVILNYPARGLDANALVREVGFVIAFLRERNARLSGSLQTALAARHASIRSVRTTPLDVAAFDDYDQEFVAPVDPDALPASTSVVRLTDEALGEAARPALEEAFRLLATKDLIEVREVADERVFVAPEERRTELAFYKNNIIHYFVPEAVFATAVYAVEGTRIDREDVRSYARLLSRLLKHEFCFEERSRFDDVLAGTTSYFVDRGWISVGADGRIDVTDPPPAGVEFLRGLLIPTIEAYYVAARGIAELATDWVEERALLKKVIARGKALHLKGEIQYGEAYSKATLENAVRVYREWGVVVTREDTRARRKVRELRVSDEYAGELVAELQADLAALTARQRRRPGEFLRRV